jgi:LysR family hydrogen peroxide-inducible transcriptional activator
VELHQLRYVVAVAKAGNFTRAAEELFLAQPSLSVQVRKLEHELGVRLFERLGRSVQLTHAGEIFLEHAQRALFEVAEARDRMADVRDLRRGRLALGALPSVGAHLLPDVLAAFKRAHPGVQTSLVELDVSADVERLVHAGQLDLAVIRLPRTREDLADRLLARERLVAVVPPDSEFAGRSELALLDLADQDFVGMRPGHGLRELMNRVCVQAGFLPRVTVETGQLSIVCGMVRAGVGVSVLPKLAAGEGVTAVPLADPFAYRDLGVVWRAHQPVSPPTAAFLQLLRTSVAPPRPGHPEACAPVPEPPAEEADSH